MDLNLAPYEAWIVLDGLAWNDVGSGDVVRALRDAGYTIERRCCRESGGRWHCVNCGHASIGHSTSGKCDRAWGSDHWWRQCEDAALDGEKAAKK